MDSKSNSRKPVQQFKVCGIQVAIWRNESKECQEFSSISMDKRYKIGEEWRSTTSLKASDLPKAILALQKAYEFLSVKDFQKDSSAG